MGHPVKTNILYQNRQKKAKTKIVFRKWHHNSLSITFTFDGMLLVEVVSVVGGESVGDEGEEAGLEAADLAPVTGPACSIELRK